MHDESPVVNLNHSLQGISHVKQDTVKPIDALCASEMD